MSIPPAELDALGGGGAFFLVSFPFLTWAGSVFVLPEVSCVVAARVGRGGTAKTGGAEVEGGRAPGRYWGMEEVGRGGGAPLTWGTVAW